MMESGMRYCVVCFFFVWVFCFDVNAKTMFLPDWQNGEVGFKQTKEDTSYDENMCRRAAIYHKANSCSKPKIFDEYCPFDNDWISECYCPEVFSQNCEAPYKGDIREVDDEGYASCDGLWIACCDATCPAGTAVNNVPGCDGDAGANACGETCYYPYRGPTPDEAGCEWGTVDCSDDCGGTRKCCAPCLEEPDVDASTCSYGTTTCTDQCGKTYTCCATCTPANDVDSSTCSYGTASCIDHCGETYTCCADCTASADETGCSYGTKDCDDGCGETRQCCKTCTDNGGTEACTGQTTVCGANQIEKSTCTNCSGVTLYTCEDKAPTCADGGYLVANPNGWNCSTVSYQGLTCYSKTECTTTVTVNSIWGSEWSGNTVCGGGPWTSPDYKNPGETLYTSFPRAVCESDGFSDTTTATVKVGAEIRIYANGVSGVGGYSCMYPCGASGLSCSKYNSYWECYATLSLSGSTSFGITWCYNADALQGCDFIDMSK